jgi:hypothetical protein
VLSYVLRCFVLCCVCAVLCYAKLLHPLRLTFPNQRNYDRLASRRDGYPDQIASLIGSPIFTHGSHDEL